MGACEFGTCDICGKQKILKRKYFIYPVHCRCCGCKVEGQNCHFELVCHCDDCVPETPKAIHVTLEDINKHEYRLEIKVIEPIKIE